MKVCVGVVVITVVVGLVVVDAAVAVVGVVVIHTHSDDIDAHPSTKKRRSSPPAPAPARHAAHVRPMHSLDGRIIPQNKQAAPRPPTHDNQPTNLDSDPATSA